MTAPPVVVLRRLPEAIEEMAKLVEVALARVVLPCTSKFPEVVAPPEMVSPPACAPLPIVEDALTRMPMVVVGVRYPLVTCQSRWSSEIRPRELVAVSAYVPFD